MHRSAPAKKIAAKSAKKTIKTKTQRKVTSKTQRRKFATLSFQPVSREIPVVNDNELMIPGPIVNSLHDFATPLALFTLNLDSLLSNDSKILHNSSDAIRKRLHTTGKKFTPFELELASDPYGIRARSTLVDDLELPKGQSIWYNHAEMMITGATLTFAAAYAHDLIFSTPLSASGLIDLITFDDAGCGGMRSHLHTLSPAGESTFMSRALWAIPGAIIAIPFSFIKNGTPEEQDIYQYSPPKKQALRYLKHLDGLLEEGTYNKSVVAAMTNNNVTMNQILGIPPPKDTSSNFPQNYDTEPLAGFFTQDPKHAHESH